MCFVGVALAVMGDVGFFLRIPGGDLDLVLSSDGVDGDCIGNSGCCFGGGVFGDRDRSLCGTGRGACSGDAFGGGDMILG